MLDLDKITLPDGLAVLTDPAGCAAYARELLERYAPELRGVAMIVQLSSSAGINPASRTFSAHFWFFTALPHTSEEINRWAEDINFRYRADKLAIALTLEGDAQKDALANIGTERKGLLDASMYDRVHVHYFVAPVFIDMDDPIAQRSWVLDGPHGAARLTIPDADLHAARVNAAKAERKAAKAALKRATAAPGVAGAVAVRVSGGDSIADGHGFGGFHDPIMSVTLQHAIADPDGTGDAVFIAGLSAEILAAPRKDSRAADEVEHYASAAELQRLIDGGRKWLITEAAQRQRTEEAVRAAKRKAVGDAPPVPIMPLGLAHRVLDEQSAADMARIVSGEVVNRLVKQTVGAGKTYAYMRAVARSTSSLVRVDAFAPTGVLQDEMAAKYFPAGLVLRGRTYKAGEPAERLCIHAQIANAVYTAGSPASPTICNGCPLAPRKDEGPNCGYLMQFIEIGDWETVIATHGHLLGLMPDEGLPVKWLDDRMPRAVVVDEVIDPFEHVEFTVADYSVEKFRVTLWTGNNSDTPRPEPKPAVAGEKKKRRKPVKQHATAVEIDIAARVAMQALAGEWLPSETGEYWTPPSTLSPGFLWSAIRTFEKARVLSFSGGWSHETIKEELAKPQGVKRQKVQRLLEHVLAGHGPRTRSPTIDGKFTVTMMKQPLIDAGTSLIVLDATTPPVLVSALYGREFEVSEQRVKQHIEVRRITGLTGSMVSLTGRDTRVDWENASEDDQNLDEARMKALLEIYVWFAKGRTLLVVGQQKLTEALKEHAGKRYPHIVFKHFNSLRGVDDYKDYWGVVIMGYQQIALDVVERQRACLNVPGQTTMADWSAANPDQRLHPDGYLRHPDTGAAFHPDELTEAMRWNACEGEMVQCIGRLRGVRDERAAASVQLLVIGDMHIPDLPKPLQTWDWATVLRWGMKGTALTQHDARMFAARLDVSPRARQDVADLSPDLFANVVSVKNALAEEGGIPAGYLALEYRRVRSKGKFSIAVSRNKFDEAWWGENFALGHFAYALRLTFNEDVEVRHIQE